jgi:hypothetical protein
MDFATLKPVVPLSTLRVAPSGNVRVICWGAASAIAVSSQSLHTKQVR